MTHIERDRPAARAASEASQSKAKRENAQHTAGPWTHEGHGDITGIENDPARGCVGKVDVCSVYMRVVPGRQDANARLIAAAPDLVFQLLSAANYIDALGGDSKSHRAAIAKALGDTP